ncbi:MAG: Gfo/Idh/MocA family protein [Acutalibacteraceae bacterium]|jgi:predicted dehydrogenase
MGGTRKVGYAVLGLGVGRAHARAVLNSPNGKLVAVCDLIPEKLEKAKEEYGDILTYTDFEEMLKNPEIEIISVALPSGMHADFAVRAMEAGKHVLVEKPIDITVEAAQKIIDACKRTGKKAGVIHQNRFNAVMKPMKEAIDSGRLGKIFLGTFAVKWYRTQEYYDTGGWRGTWSMDGGGSLMNQAIHTVDLMQWLMGDVESVTSNMGIFSHDIETEDMTASLIKFKSGASATFVSSTSVYPGLGTNIQVYGTKGSIEVEGERLELWRLEDEDEDKGEAMMEMYGAGNNAPTSPDPTKVFGHATQVNDIIDAVLFDREPLIVPSDAIKSVKIANAIYESARTGKTVYLD